MRALNANWKSMAVSLVGNDHVRHELPCQDASAAFSAPRPAAVVCDGAGSARESHVGAREAVRVFRIAVETLEPYLADALDSERVPSDFTADLWHYVAVWICRSLVAAKNDAARVGTGDPRDYDFTFAAAIVGRLRSGFVQLGDGAIVVNVGGKCSLALQPEKGRYANTTTFLDEQLIENDEIQTTVLPTKSLDGVMVMSDGPEIKMLDLTSGRPAPIVSEMLADFADGQCDRASVLNYLTGSRWSTDPRGGDDKSVAMLARESNSTPL